MLKMNELFLLSEQTALGYDYTVAGSATMDGTNLLEVMKGSSIEREQPVDPLLLVSGNFDQDAAVPGDEGSKGTLTLPIIPAVSGGDVLPGWAKALKALCSFGVSQTTQSGADKFVLSALAYPTVSGLLHHYTGGLGSNAALKSIHYNLLGDWKISITANKAPTLQVTVEGAWHSQSTATQPSGTKARVSPVAFKGATVTIGGLTLKILSAEISGNAPAINTIDVSQANGRGFSKITDRKIKFSCKAYAVTTGTADPVANVKAGTEGTTVFTWGSAEKTITFTGAYGQLTKCVKSEENEVTTFDIEGQYNRNDFSASINNA